MNQPGRNDYWYLYDWQKACELARADGWNADPYDAPNRIERSVQADFDYLSGWINDQWSYVIVTVTDTESGYSQSLGCVETYKDYHYKCAHDLEEELQARIDAESTECQYWQERDVVTI
jgi:hypothetical protein